ncbi:AbrB family transcriptional regulator [Archangium sp.]|uniref:AbrB family transcriptional regulator n=1 Tax=Archangium sp. TaxID=1872627 RepID=UPI002D3ADE26|nr:AbrB family transcriptional regulator [Archangium sp.]HYO58878.1 AbrB family transcriptional regulator [Archangium sp.]
MAKDSKPDGRSRSRVWAVTAATLLGAALGEWTRVPAGALFGGMLVSLVTALSLSVFVPMPRPLLLCAQAVLGAALCSSFSPSAWSALAEHWPVALVNVVGVVAIGQAVALVFSRLGGVDVRTATLGLMPGGLSAMVALSEELGVDSRLVTLFQYLRLSLVILVAAVVGRWTGGGTDTQVATAAALPGAPLPVMAWGVTALVALVGGAMGVWLKLPAGAFLGPLLLGIPLTALGIPVGAWPPGLLPLGLWALGVRVGRYFDKAAVHELKRVVLGALGAALAMVGGCLLLAWLWSSVGGVDLLTTYFATSPGGADSVLAIALETRASLSLVIAVQVGRLLLVFLVAPLVMRRLVARR